MTSKILKLWIKYENKYNLISLLYDSQYNCIFKMIKLMDNNAKKWNIKDLYKYLKINKNESNHRQ